MWKAERRRSPPPPPAVDASYDILLLALSSSSSSLSYEAKQDVQFPSTMRVQQQEINVYDDLIRR
jgi:hypothetical protein